MFSRLLFLLVKISLRASFTLIKLLAVGNYDKSLQKFEDGIILVHVVIRVILQERKCLCHVREWLPCVPGGLLTLAKDKGSCVASSEWMKHGQCTIPFTATKCTENIHTDVLDIFPHAQTEPIQMAANGYKAIKSWKIHVIMTGTSASTVRTKTWLHPLLSACWTCTAILVSVYSLSHLCISVEPMLETTDSSEVMFTSLFSGKWKFETLLVRRAKSYFLLVLSWRNAFQFGGILVSLITFLLWPYLSSLLLNPWYCSPCTYPKQCPLVYLIADDSNWMG